MRRFAVAAALAAILVPAAALEAAASPNSSSIRGARSYALGCEVMRAGFIDVRNTTKQTIPRGTAIELVVVATVGKRTHGIKRTVTTRQPLEAGLYHAFAAPQGAQSCNATVRLLPDYYRR